MASAVPEWVDPELYPFRGEVLDIDGHRLHYIDEGSGPTLLFLHGNPTWSFVWRGVIARLSGSFRCVAPDLPGFGLSTAPPDFDGRPASIAAVIERFVTELNLRDAVLVAQDWGGPIGLAVAERMPDRFAGLALGNTWAWPITGDPHFERFSAVMGGPVGARLIRRANLFVNLMIPLGHRRRSLTRDEMRHYRAALATPARRQASAVLPREIVHSAEFLREVEQGLDGVREMPALLVWADRDIAFRRTELERWRRELPAATVVEIPGAGHFLQSDAPDEFAAALRAWHRAGVAPVAR
ncbi:alpha/beta fold hydrolase [Dactylosporangium matsuzakiense]|uniref:Haloalkane dehalogenase 2 n=1 Tax=Dactylosporangium matsuzakiense TaxID=53360 RepID=A0A9W6KVU7_9ACTN|nr:alpha/beta fold hydrolase [Dactylosporangium matsuzakiense]GLL08115.1 haloalkane dehalogenase 2 [Dactylosporangium matsuzakiense]